VLRPDMHVFWRGERLADPERLAAAATGFASAPYSAPTVAMTGS